MARHDYPARAKSRLLETIGFAAIKGEHLLLSIEEKPLATTLEQPSLATRVAESTRATASDDDLLVYLRLAENDELE
ncbi:MAG: hypothetical protein R3B96_18435 [Pirellulaceae bacterium]